MSQQNNFSTQKNNHLSSMQKMFRIRGHLLNIRNLLQHHQQHIQATSSAQSRQYKVQVRDPCPPKPSPPPPKPKDDTAFWGAMVVFFLAGGFVVIAKRSPEIRDWLTINAPWFDDIIAVAYEENYTYEEFAKKCIEDVRKFFSPSTNLPKECSLKIDEPAVSQDASECEPKKDEPIKSEAESRSCEDLPPPAPIIVTKTVCEIIDRLRDRGEDALNNYHTAKNACSLYNQIVSDTMQNFSFPTMKELHAHMAERLNLVEESIKKAEEATADVDELTRYLECGAIGSKEDIESAKQLMKDYQQKIKASCIKYQWENDRSVVFDTHWQMVEKIVDNYSNESETMFPEIKYEQNKLQLEGDLDLLLYHTSRYSKKLRAELNDVVEAMTERVNRAIETLPQGEKDNKNREAMLQEVLKEKRAELNKEYQKRYDDQNTANENLLKKSLRKQLERHQDSMEKKLKQKEKEANKKMDKLIAEKVQFERRLFAKQLNEMAIKLKIIEDKLNARLKAENDTKRSQELWRAGASLLAATKKGDPYVKVDKELKAIEKASGDGDKLVRTVLQAIPESVKEKGLVPESVLREKYHQMERVALKVALVEQDGAPLPIYFLSWLQSALLFMKLSGIPQHEIDKPPEEPFKDLDTFDLLQRARFWIERGNLSAAIRYVSSLEGASRAAAKTWYDAATSHLETRQAAEAVIAHAAAMGVKYI